MASSIIGGAPKEISLDVDEEGQRTYTVDWLVQTDGPSYGPDHAIYCPGLPAPGASLNIGNSVDAWAFYQRKGSAKLLSSSNRRDVYKVTQQFSTRPIRRCQSGAIEDPLMEPHRVRGGADTFTREAMADYQGKPLLYSNGQRMKGPAVQMEDGWPTIEIEQNVAWVNLAFLGNYRYATNNATFWGCAARTLKCKSINWERVLYGTCYYYFRVTTVMQLNAQTWDVLVLDEGDLVKVPGSSPARFRQAKDDREENVHVLLDGSGNALAPGATEVFLPKRVLRELDFSVVGWPATLL